MTLQARDFSLYPQTNECKRIEELEDLLEDLKLKNSE